MIDAPEAVEWTDIPGVSTVTAATFCRQLQWAKAAVDGTAEA